MDGSCSREQRGLRTRSMTLVRKVLEHARMSMDSRSICLDGFENSFIAHLHPDECLNCPCVNFCNTSRTGHVLVSLEQQAF